MNTYTVADAVRMLIEDGYTDRSNKVELQNRELLPRSATVNTRVEFFKNGPHKVKVYAGIAGGWLPVGQFVDGSK